ncbi:sensor histidine kinase [Reichenbachiella faecimaris]|nr:ATP-binding protein [Reichenbachiella faecimaris]
MWRPEKLENAVFRVWNVFASCSLWQYVLYHTFLYMGKNHPVDKKQKRNSNLGHAINYGLPIFIFACILIEAILTNSISVKNTIGMAPLFIAISFPLIIGTVKSKISTEERRPFQFKENTKKFEPGKKHYPEDNDELRKAELKIHNLEEELVDLEKKVITHRLESNLLRKELEEFSYSVSHDLRAPLRIIEGFSSILLEDYLEKLDDEGQQSLKTISSNATKLNLLIEGIRELSSIGRKELFKSEIEAKPLVEEVLTLIKDNQKLAHFDFKTDIKESSSFYGDRALMNQALTHMINNAIKFSNKEKKPTIEIGFTTQNGSSQFYLKDNGVGFNMNHYSKIFKPLERLHKMNEFEGIGMGLAIVQKIVDRHGGYIEGQSKINHGSTFYIYIPAQDDPKDLSSEYFVNTQGLASKEKSKHSQIS